MCLKWRWIVPVREMVYKLSCRVLYMLHIIVSMKYSMKRSGWTWWCVRKGGWCNRRSGSYRAGGVQARFKEVKSSQCADDCSWTDDGKEASPIDWTCNWWGHDVMRYICYLINSHRVVLLSHVSAADTFENYRYIRKQIYFHFDNKRNYLYCLIHFLVLAAASIIGITEFANGGEYISYIQLCSS